jgi:hypothetical protein
MADEKGEKDQHINDRYINAIDYYWKASRNNKKCFERVKKGRKNRVGLPKRKNAVKFSGG